MIKKYLLIIGIIALTNLSLFSQSVTNSPYTRFGIGDIDRNGFNNSKAMGGITTGLRKNNQINYLNPAAISAQDTMSFIFDIGLSGIFKNMESNTASADFNDFAFDHLAFSFPIKRWWFTSLGVTPYSKIGYNIHQVEDYAPIDSVNINYDYYGNGGIIQLFLTNSFKINENLSLGFNVNYLFGSKEQYNQVYLDTENSFTTIIEDNISMNKITYDVGLQYYNDISNKYFYVVGLNYSSKVDFNTTKKSNVFMAENFNLYDINVLDYIANSALLLDTISSSTTNNYKIEIPAKYSIGFTTGIKDKLILGFDYSYQDWSKVGITTENSNLVVDENFKIGVEYIPNRRSIKDYYKRVNYRAGLYLNNSYIKINDEQIKNYGITFGLGFPIYNQRTSLNFSCTLGKRGTTNNSLIEENYTAIGINLTLYDFWFIKRKFQ
ncbi:MAG: hypothetical protein PF485_00295 [Bacteroidales bacterium]|jgi:hypothetical protein|nr:hypothetical protein [Bacteroidales bacterium]